MTKSISCGILFILGTVKRNSKLTDILNGLMEIANQNLIILSITLLINTTLYLEEIISVIIGIVVNLLMYHFTTDKVLIKKNHLRLKVGNLK